VLISTLKPHLIKFEKNTGQKAIKNNNNMADINPTINDSVDFHLPVWLNDNEIDPLWIRQKIPEFKAVTKASVKDISNAGRRGDKAKNGATLLLDLSFDETENACTCTDGDGEAKTKTTSLVIKQCTPTGLSMSQQLGLAREACFFNQLASRVEFQNLEAIKDNDSKQGTPCIPKVYYAYGDIQSGNKFVIMEDLSDNYIDSGILFGPGNPNNWNRDLPAKIASAFPEISPPSSFQVANETFLAIAQVHATFWKDTNLLNGDYEWLRGAAWINGQQEASWKASQGLIQGFWKNLESTIDDRIKWDPLVKKLIDKAVAGVSWEAQLERLNPSKHFTLVHGDFWPGNIMISKTDLHDLRLLDWEMVGIGSGPQDLGQYILSNMNPAERRECEHQLIRNYHNELVRHGVDFSWEDCWNEYRIGGLERWLWFLVYFCAQQGPLLKWAQFFHDQIKEFVHDHTIQPDEITQPRP
jgi:Ecdysteroid kinase-like family